MLHRAGAFTFNEFGRSSRSTQPTRLIRICALRAGGGVEIDKFVCVTWELSNTEATQLNLRNSCIIVF